MKIAVRADASVEIGSGHVMRCLTLVDALATSGDSVLFMCRRLPGHAGEMIASRGYHVHWLERDGRDDAQASRTALRNAGNIDWLVVDHYGLSAAWERYLRDSTGKLMAVDDLADRPHACDLLLDQNYYRNPASRYQGLLPPQVRILLGPEYALLREEFRVARESGRAGRSGDKRVLVFFGGSDAGGETCKCLAALEGIDGVAADVVLGYANPHAATIAEFCAAKPAFKLYRQPADMANLMLSADLALGASGTTTWERGCLGVPQILVSLAENQYETGRDLAYDGYVRFLGRAHQVSMADWRKAVEKLLYDDSLRNELAKSCSGLVDGLGANRVVKVMRKFSE